VADEAAIRDRCAAGDFAAAATAALELYGSELLGYLHATAREPDLANEAYAELGEDFWRALPKFRWGSSLRTWLYTLARNALGQLRRRRKRTVPLSLAPELAAVVRTHTLEFQRTDVKDEFRVLREALDPDEHELLLLRLDRDLPWKDIAAIIGGEPAALRKRFERAKERLKKLAIDRGIIAR
jgi:RNA polymerase sigma-70 factor (ECF subfamily)